jgi:S-adenosylmethionine:tRNA ribosyltransferase-isomerase
VVLNDTRVIAARLDVHRSSGGRVELTFVPPLVPGAREAEALAQARGRLRPGEVLAGAGGQLQLEVLDHTGPGRFRLRLLAPTSGDLPGTLAAHGRTPLPPYIGRARRAQALEALDDERSRYQTVYARRPGAVAAPTAGLHYTPELLEALRVAGIEVTALTLHVGPGTFLPVRTQDPRDHPMEGEWAEVPPDCAGAIARTRHRGGRVIATGTTCTRALESAAGPDGRVRPGPLQASIFIHPPYRFRVIDGLLTNFHLPDATPCLLVAALLGGPLLRAAYEHALAGEYRFYSYGDAMLVT